MNQLNSDIPAGLAGKARENIRC